MIADEKMKADLFPWLVGREHVEAKPQYKIVARSMSLSGNSIVMLHKAGSQHVENYFIRDIVNDSPVQHGMDPKEFELLRWVIQSEDSNPLDDLGQ
ncbi:MAG: hypothetical protein WAW86_02250 [Gammaproteobacteria bacterium]